MNQTPELSVTPIETFRLASQGTVIQIPGFEDGTHYNVRVRKPNPITLVKLGKIPNGLMQTAADLFTGKKKSFNTGSMSFSELTELVAVLELLCEASLVTPTLKELTATGVELTIDQMVAIVNFGQKGVQELDSFRSLSGNVEDRQGGDNVELSSESDTQN